MPRGAEEKRVQRLLQWLPQQYGKPEGICTDNGSESTSAVVRVCCEGESTSIHHSLY